MSPAINVFSNWKTKNLWEFLDALKFEYSFKKIFIKALTKYLFWMMKSSLFSISGKNTSSTLTHSTTHGVRTSAKINFFCISILSQAESTGRHDVDSGRRVQAVMWESGFWEKLMEMRRTTLWCILMQAREQHVQKQPSRDAVLSSWVMQMPVGKG